MAIPNFKLYWTLLVLIVVCSEESSAIKRICGEVLAETLDLLCTGKYHTKLKKSMNNIPTDFENGLSIFDIGLADYANYNEIEDDQLPYKYADSPFLPRIFGDSFNLITKTRRRREGVQHECCDKGCTKSQILAYCVH